MHFKVMPNIDRQETRRQPDSFIDNLLSILRLGLPVTPFQTCGRSTKSFVSNHQTLKHKLLTIISQDTIGRHAKSPGSWESGSQRPEHLKQPKHLRVARRPATQRQVPNFIRFLLKNTQYQLNMTISLQSQSISQLPEYEYISKRPESHLKAAREHLTASREHLLAANEQSQQPPSISKWLEGLYFNHILVHADQFAATYNNLQQLKIINHGPKSISERPESISKRPESISQRPEDPTPFIFWLERQHFRYISDLSWSEVLHNGNRLTQRGHRCF